MTRPNFENLLLLAASLAISLVATEIAGRWLQGGTVDTRMLLFSENPGVFDEGFVDDTDYRSLALGSPPGIDAVRSPSR